LRFPKLDTPYLTAFDVTAEGAIDFVCGPTLTTLIPATHRRDRLDGSWRPMSRYAQPGATRGKKKEKFMYEGIPCSAATAIAAPVSLNSSK
jgi:hypothetical protein